MVLSAIYREKLKQKKGSDRLNERLPFHPAEMGSLGPPILVNTFLAPMQSTDPISRCSDSLQASLEPWVTADLNTQSSHHRLPFLKKGSPITRREEAAARASTEARPQRRTVPALSAIKRQARQSKARASAVTCCGVGAAPTPVPAGAPAPATAPATAVAAAATTTVVRAAMFARRDSRACARDRLQWALTHAPRTVPNRWTTRAERGADPA